MGGRETAMLTKSLETDETAPLYRENRFKE
jgi:hypothetical protein